MRDVPIKPSDVFYGFILFTLSTGLLYNVIALLLLPLIFPLRFSFDKYLLIFVALACIIGISGLLTGSHTAIRAVIFPLTYIISYWIGRGITKNILSVFATFVALEVAVSIPLWFGGIFSPFPFILPPWDESTTGAHVDILYYWKTAGLSANASLFAFKLIVLISVREQLPPAIRKSFFLFFVILPLSMSRTLFVGMVAYAFVKLKTAGKLTSLFLGLAVAILYFDAVMDIVTVQLLRGYTGVLGGPGDVLAENQNRFVFWFYGIREIVASPFFGSFGAPVTMMQHDGSAARLHSVFIQLAADYGIFVLALWLIFFFSNIGKLGASAIPILVWLGMNQSYLGMFAFADIMLFVAIFSGASPPSSKVRRQRSVNNYG